MLCVPRTIVKEYLVKLMEAEVPVLCETPPAQNVKELCDLWEMTQKLNGKVQIVEHSFNRIMRQAWRLSDRDFSVKLQAQCFLRFMDIMQ